MGGNIIHRESGDAKILVNSVLPPGIQQVFLEHEIAQLDIIRKYALTGRPIDGALGKDHEAGLAAGFKKAEELGILDEYLKIRGE